MRRHFFEYVLPIEKLERGGLRTTPLLNDLEV